MLSDHCTGPCISVRMTLPKHFNLLSQVSYTHEMIPYTLFSSQGDRVFSSLRNECMLLSLWKYSAVVQEGNSCYIEPLTKRSE